MKKNNIALALSFILITYIFSGCTLNKQNYNSENDLNKKILKISAFEGGYGSDYWYELKKGFEEKYDDVYVEITTSTDIESLIRPQIKSGNIPDIIYLSTGRTEQLTEELIRDKKLHNLNNMLNTNIPGENIAVKDKILEGFLDTSSTNPYDNNNTYLAPLFFSPTGLFYNKSLFGEGKYTLPETWGEMFMLGDSIRDDDLSLFSYSTAGYWDSVIPSMISSAGGIESYNDMINYKIDFWESEPAIKVLDTICNLSDYLEPTVLSNANAKGFTKNQQLVLDNKALFIPNGNWLPDEMKNSSRASNFEWGFMAYPSFSKNGDRYSLNFFEQMFILEDSKNIELAEKFMVYMYSDEGVEIIAKHAKAVSPVKNAINIASKYLDDVQLEMYKIYDNGAKPVMGNFAPISISDSNVNLTEAYIGNIDAVMSKEKTASKWKEELNDIYKKINEK